MPRLIALSGVAFVLLVVLAVALVGGSPANGSGASGADVAAFYDGHPPRQFAAPFVLAAAALFLVLFAVRLAAGSSSGWGQVLIAGSVLTGAVVLGMASVRFALGDAAEQGVSPAALEALNVLDGNTWVAFHAGFGVMMIGAAGSLIGRTGAYGWLGRVALVLGIALFVPVADFVALLLTAVWILVTSVVLFREHGREDYATSAAHGIAA